VAYGYTAVVDAAAAASSTTITRTVTYSGGEPVVVFVEWSTTSGTVTVADGTNTYTQAGSIRTLASTKNRSRAVFYCLSPAAGAVTVTATFSASKLGRRIGVARYTGLNGYQVELGQGQITPGTGTDAVTTGNLTPSAQPAALISLSNSMNTTAPTITAGTGFTGRGTLASWDALAGDTSLLEDIRLTSTSNVPATATTNGATEDFLTQALILTESSNATGTFASTLADTAGALDGKVTDAGAFSSTLADTIAAFSGAVLNPGAFASTLGDTVGAFAGAVGNAVTGAFASALANLSAEFSGAIPVTGAFSSTLDNLTGAFSGAVSGTSSGGWVQRISLRIGLSLS
jgi:hypothetical protein